MEQDKYITQFSTYLFWDVKREDLDMEKHSRYIIKRVLEYGMLLDWKMVLQLSLIHISEPTRPY